MPDVYCTYRTTFKLDLDSDVFDLHLQERSTGQSRYRGDVPLFVLLREEYN